MVAPLTEIWISPNPNLTCQVTSIMHPLIHQAGDLEALETGRADRRYRAEYELFNYFYRN